MWAMTLSHYFMDPLRNSVHWEISIIGGITMDILGDLFVKRDS